MSGHYKRTRLSHKIKMGQNEGYSIDACVGISIQLIEPHHEARRIFLHMTKTSDHPVEIDIAHMEFEFGGTAPSRYATLKIRPVHRCEMIIFELRTFAQFRSEFVIE